MRSGRTRAAGFTLLEVAIALAIVGVGVVTVLELFSAGLRMEGAAGTRAHAVVYARGLLDETYALPEIKPGNGRGQYDDGYRWEWSIREAPEYTDTDRKDVGLNLKSKDKDFKPHDLGPTDELTLYEVEVSVSWPESAYREGVYTIRTLRVAPRQKP